MNTNLLKNPRVLPSNDHQNEIDVKEINIEERQQRSLVSNDNSFVNTSRGNVSKHLPVKLLQCFNSFSKKGKKLF